MSLLMKYAVFFVDNKRIARKCRVGVQETRSYYLDFKVTNNCKEEGAHRERKRRWANFMVSYCSSKRKLKTQK